MEQRTEQQEQQEQQTEQRRERQQVLYLWANGSSLDSGTIGWAFHDGTDGNGPAIPLSTPPYPSGVDALRDGWMLLQSSQLVAPSPGEEHLNTYLEYEFVFERRVTTPFS